MKFNVIEICAGVGGFGLGNGVTANVAAYIAGKLMDALSK